GWGRRRRDRRAAEPEHADPGRRADEHQDGEGELIAAYWFEAGHPHEMPVLHVALAPAQVAADEIRERWRVLLEARAFLRPRADRVAGLAHQHRLDLVVAEHMALDQRASAEHRQVAIGDEGRQPHDRVVPPIRTAIALPPGAADGVGAHAQPHAKLED